MEVVSLSAGVYPSSGTFTFFLFCCGMKKEEVASDRFST